MEARALVQGHARTGSWMAIRVDLENDGPAFTGELRLVGGTQGRTRFALPGGPPHDVAQGVHPPRPAPGLRQQLEIALVTGEAVVARGPWRSRSTTRGSSWSASSPRGRDRS